MRKKMLLLALSLATTASALASPILINPGGSHPCQQCTTLSNGAQCCISCVCNDAGIPFLCALNDCAVIEP
jgi:hypothetical protein